MKISKIEKKFEKLGFSISYCPRQNKKCGFVLKKNGRVTGIYDNANQAAKLHCLIK